MDRETVLSDRFDTAVAWTSYHRSRLLAAGGVLAAAAAVTVTVVFGGFGSSGSTPSPSATTFPQAPPLPSQNGGIPRPAEPGFVVPAEGECLEVLTELREMFDTYSAGVQMEGADLERLGRLNPRIGEVCSPEVETAFRTWELVPWLNYVPEPDVVAGGRPNTTTTAPSDTGEQPLSTTGS